MLLSKDGGEIQVNKASKELAISDKTPTGKVDFRPFRDAGDLRLPREHHAVETLLTQLDTKPQQVLVEATILQCSLNRPTPSASTSRSSRTWTSMDPINIGGPLSAANLIKGGYAAANQGFSPPDNQGVAIGSTPGNTSVPARSKPVIVTGRYLDLQSRCRPGRRHGRPLEPEDPAQSAALASPRRQASWLPQHDRDRQR